MTIRVATLADIPFIDSLQKKHSRMVSFLKEQALMGKINAGQVLIAEEIRSQTSEISEGNSGLTSDLRPLTSGIPVGYVIGSDKYFKRENVGVIYQLNVSPGKQRNLVGVQLVKAMFERAHVSCTLFCLWCAQDLEANHFWESLGFIPLAFRAGSRAKDRVHIFWQRRIREGDEQTPWWYPTETTGGMMGEARLVFPIPPGVHWSDPMPRVLPASQAQASLPAEKKKSTGCKPVTQKPVAALGRLQFTLPVEKKEKPKREKPPKMKNDPALVAKARELNSRWLEEINNNPAALPAPGGKYQVSKQIENAHAPALSQRERGTNLLEAA